jgi:hypothetical protein
MIGQIDCELGLAPVKLWEPEAEETIEKWLAATNLKREDFSPGVLEFLQDAIADAIEEVSKG